MKTLTFYSPISGVVTKKDVVAGMKLDAGAMPYEIVDLSQVWVLADVYESELRHVKVGMPATLTLRAFPDRPFKGKVSFIDPLLDPEDAHREGAPRVRRTRRGELRPEMFGEVVLQGAAREGLRVPADAVIDSGSKSVVFVSLGEGKFQPREVQVGASDGTSVEVVSRAPRGREGGHPRELPRRLRVAAPRLARRARARGRRSARRGPDRAGRAAGRSRRERRRRAAAGPHAGHGGAEP